jgi:hypothetical protein
MREARGRLTTPKPRRGALGGEGCITWEVEGGRCAPCSAGMQPSVWMRCRVFGGGAGVSGGKLDCSLVDQGTSSKLAASLENAVIAKSYLQILAINERYPSTTRQCLTHCAIDE